MFNRSAPRVLICRAGRDMVHPGYRGKGDLDKDVKAPDVYMRTVRHPPVCVLPAAVPKHGSPLIFCLHPSHAHSMNCSHHHDLLGLS